MKWVLFTRTWRLTNEHVEQDVRKAVREVIGRGDGVLTGGSTGVDYFAMDEALKSRPDGSYLKVVIPAYLEDFIHDYHTNWLQAPITTKDVEAISALLEQFKRVNPSNLIEMPYHAITQEHYFMRDSEEVEMADEVFAFQVNKSIGTQDTIDKARKAGLPINLHKEYSI